ncbi:MAG: right-handed parallel beta-helix repeat-containing protein, partial [Bacillota bacterium]|nr:right-handed parallel beta-helix repeat-containing protein [Bacillota bacterium]
MQKLRNRLMAVFLALIMLFSSYGTPAKARDMTKQAPRKTYLPFKKSNKDKDTSQKVNLKISAKSSQNSITISWNSIEAALNYDIEVDGKVIDVGQNTSYAHMGLEQDSKHIYRLRVNTQNQFGKWSEPFTISTESSTPASKIASKAVKQVPKEVVKQNDDVKPVQIPIPSIPSNLNSMPTTNSIIITWNQVNYAEGYDIEVDGVVKDCGSKTTYVDDNLSPETSHSYRVRAKNSSGISGWSDYIKQSTLEEPLDTPQNIIGVPTKDSITVIWDAVKNATGYDIEIDGVVKDNDTSTTYTESSLVPGTAHVYRIRAKKKDKLGSWSQLLVKTTLTDSPNSPNGNNTPGNSDANGSTANTDTLSVGTNNKEGNTQKTSSEISAGSINDKTISKEGTENNTQKVTSVTTTNSTAVDTSPPTAPTNLTAAAPTDSSVNLSWTAATDDVGVTEYDIYADTTFLAAVKGAASYNLTGLKPNTTYNLSVIAKDATGNQSSVSNVVQVETLIDATKPTIPTNLTVTNRTDSTISLSWTAATDNVGIVEYDIYNNGTNFIGSVDGATTSYNVIGLSPNTAYNYTIVAKDAEGNVSSPSIGASGYTMLETPVNINVASSNSLAWGAITGATSYAVEVNGSIVQSVTQNNYSFNWTLNTKYSVRIRANNGNTLSDWSIPFIFTPVGGNITQNTTWNTDSGIYILSEALKIANGVTLTINPGVVLESCYIQNYIEVDGTLSAKGTVDNPIVFTTYKDSQYGGSGVTNSAYDYWEGIKISATGEFDGDNVKIRYGGVGVYDTLTRWFTYQDTAINVSGRLNLTNSEVSNAYGYSVNVNSSDNVLLQNNTLETQTADTIYINSTSTGTITVIGNTISSGSGSGININQFGSGNLILKNNNITNCSQSGIKVNLNGLKSSIFSGIQNNTFDGNQYNGIYVLGTLSINIELTKNVYYFNNIIVPSGMALMVDPGVILKNIAIESNIEVDGTLSAKGTADNPIVFTANKDSQYGGSGVTNSAYDYWEGIKISATGELDGDNVKIRYGGVGIYETLARWYTYQDVAVNVSGKLNLTNSEVNNSYGNSINIYSSNSVLLMNNTLVTTMGDAISIDSTLSGTIAIIGNIISSECACDSGINIKQFGNGNLTIKNNKIINCKTFGIKVNLTGLKFSIFSGIQGNTFDGNQYNGIYVLGTLSINIELTKNVYYFSSIMVPNGMTLIVDPGVILKNTDIGGNIEVDGTLYAVGTADNPIVFTAYKDSQYGGSGVTSSGYDYWTGIKISATGEFDGEYVKVTYGGVAYDNISYRIYRNTALNVSGKLNLINSEVSNSYGSSVNINSSNNVLLQNNTLESKTADTIYINSASTGTITIIANTISSGSGSGININQFGSGNLVIKNNNIINCSQSGINVNLIGSASLIIESNNIINCNQSGINVNLAGLKSSIFSGIQGNTFNGNQYNGIYVLETLSINIELTKNVYYFSSIIVPSGMTLIVDPGAILKNTAIGGNIEVDGTLYAVGTADNPIVFTVNKDSQCGGSGVTNSAYDYWEGIKISATGEFDGDNVKIRYGGVGLYATLTRWYTYQDTAISVSGKLNLTNSEVSNSYGYSISSSTIIQPILLCNSFLNNSLGMKNDINISMILEAQYNYWGSAYGPCIYDSYIGKWVGDGDKVGDGINCSSWLPSELHLNFYDNGDFNPWLYNDLHNEYNYGQDDVSTTTGNFSRKYDDYEYGSGNSGLDFQRTYNSQNAKDTLLGKGWTFSYEGKISTVSYSYTLSDGTTQTYTNPNVKEVSLPDGSVITFNVNKDGTFTSANTRNTLVFQNGIYTLTAKDQTQYLFNINGYLFSILDRNGNAINIDVDANGKISTITDAAGRKYTLTYENGHIKTILDGNNNAVVTYFYTNGRLSSVQDAMKSTTYSYYYDANGLLNVIQDNGQNVLEALFYVQTAGADKGKIKTWTDQYGNTRTYSYDNVNKITTITDINGCITKDYYDSNFNIIKSIDAEGKTTTYNYFLDNYGELHIIIDRNGNETDYERDGSGNVTKTTHVADGSVESATYDDKNNIKTQTDGNGNITYYFYDPAGKNLIKKVQPINGKDVYTESEDQTKFAITVYVYYSDAEDTQLGYKIKGLLKCVIDPNGNSTNYTYTTNGDIATVTDDLGHKITNNYDNNIGLISSSISPNGYITTYKYDADGHLLATILTKGETTRTVYDAEGRVIQQISANLYNSKLDNLITDVYTGNVGTRYTYYPSGKVHTETDANNYTTTFTYDLYGNVQTEIKANGSIYTYEYDSMNRIKNIYFADNAKAAKVLLTSYTYNILSNGQTNKVETRYLNATDKAVTTFIYDYAGRQIEQDNPDGTKETVSYYATGSKKTYTDVNGATTYYNYDHLNRLIEVWTPIESINGTTLYSYSNIVYDNGGRKLSESIGKDKVKYVVVNGNVDPSSRPVNLITTSYTYYENNKVKTVTDSSGKRIEYVYDADGNLQKETDYVNTNITNVTDYVNNYFGKPDTKTTYVLSSDIYGAATTSPTISLVTSYTYDLDGNVKTITTPDNVVTTFTYDNMDRQLSMSQPGIDETGKAVTIGTSVTYDWAGKVLTSTDANNNTTSNVYNQRELLAKKIDANGGISEYFYDTAGRMVQECTPKNEEDFQNLINTVAKYYNKTSKDKDWNSNYDFNKDGIIDIYDLVNAAHSDVNSTKYLYDNMGRIKTVTLVYRDPSTLQWQSIVIKAYSYKNTSSGTVVKELDALGYEAGSGTSVDDKINNGYGTIASYNLANKIAAILNADTQDRLAAGTQDQNLPYTVSYTYDGAGRKVTETNAKGVIYTYYYNDAGNITSTTVKKTASAPEVTLQSNTYDLLGNLLTHTDGDGNVTSYEYNALSKVRKVTYPGDTTIAAYTISYLYDIMGRVKQQQDSLGKVEMSTYDNQGRELTHTEQKSDGTNAITTTAAYDKNGNKRFVTDGNHVKTENTYDTLNRLKTTSITVTDINGCKTLRTISYGYDAYGNNTTVTDWLGNVTLNIYDPLNRLIEKIDANNTVIQKLEYYDNGTQSKSYDALNNEIQYYYDKDKRLTSTRVKAADAGSIDIITETTYDEIGNKQTSTQYYDAAKTKASKTTYGYNEYNQLTSVLNAKGETTSYTYDLNGNMLTETDGRGNVTNYEYNAANKLTRRIDNGGRTGTAGNYNYNPAKMESYSYYANGNMYQKTDRNGVVTTYVYDVHGRLISEIAGKISLSFTYDNNDNKLSTADATGTTIRTYDELNRVTSKTVPDIGKATYVYDIITGVDAGCTEEKDTDAKGNVILKIYDKAGRLQKVIADGNTTTYNYYDNGNLQSVVYQGGANEQYTYYSNNLLKTLTDSNSDGTLIDKYAYTYDGAKNMLSKADSKGTTNYTYDVLNRLYTVTDPSGSVTVYTYDASGNRATATTVNGVDTTLISYDNNDQNRLMGTETKVNNITTEKVSYNYDNNGNQLTETAITYVNGAAQAPIVTTNVYDELNELTQTTTPAGTNIVNVYNGEGVRVAKAVNGIIVRYFYDSDKVVLEVDSKGNQTARNVYGTNLISRNVSGQTAVYFYNGHGDVTKLLDANGNALATYYYDAFGNITDSTGTIDNPYRYAGYQYDKETGTYYVMARMYDPVTARFMQEDSYRGDPKDPLSLNLYAYCHNEPIMFTDPTGHIF